MLKVKRLHRTPACGGEFKIVSHAVSYCSRLRMTYLFEFLPCNSLNAVRDAAVARTRTLILLSEYKFYNTVYL